MIEVALLEERLHDAEARLEKACDEIIELRGRCTEANRLTEHQTQRLLNILARVHRDGGHHTAAVGLSQSLDDADRVVAEAYASHDELDVLHNFWKSAAERALRLWEAEADKNTAILDVVDSVVCHPATSMTHDLWNALEAVLEEE